jgi:hypothetical protein
MLFSCQVGHQINGAPLEMRNYIETFWQSFDVYEENPPDPPVQIGIHTQVSGNVEEGALYAALNSSPLFVPQDAGETRFVLINKFTILNALNTNATYQQSAVTETQTPRYGIPPNDYREKKAAPGAWPSNDGDPNGPTSQKDKEGGILNPYGYPTDLAQQLELIYTVLYSKGGIYKTAAGRVLPVLKKVLNGTVTQADLDGLFAYLKKFGI